MLLSGIKFIEIADTSIAIMIWVNWQIVSNCKTVNCYPLNCNEVNLVPIRLQQCRCLLGFLLSRYYNKPAMVNLTRVVDTGGEFAVKGQ